MAKSRAVPKYRPVAPARPTLSKSAEPRHFRLDESLIVHSSWPWRAFLMMSLIMVGLCVNFAIQHYSVFYTAGWGLIAAVWFSFSMYLWRQHTRWTNGEI